MQQMLKNSLDRVIRSSLDLLLPMRCLGCGQEGEFLCLCCTTALPRLEPPFCNICADPGVIGNCGSCREQARKGERMLEGIRAPYLLEGVIRAAVHSFKYRNVRAAAPCLAACWLNTWPPILCRATCWFPFPCIPGSYGKGAITRHPSWPGSWARQPGCRLMRSCCNVLATRRRRYEPLVVGSGLRIWLAPLPVRETWPVKL